MSKRARSKAAKRQQRYRERLKARNAAATETVTLESNEYNEMTDDPGYVSPLMTPEQKVISDAVVAELDFE
jgi:hypothetical protein